MKTIVKFYKEDTAGILAVFPQIDEGNYRVMCYAHNGQHSAASIDYIKKLKFANCYEYAVLKKELESIGYDLDVRNPVFNDVVYEVNCKYGAPMGRADIGTRPDKGKIYDREVILEQGYDRGGAYWGSPNNLRVRYSKDLSYIEFYRVER